MATNYMTQEGLDKLKEEIKKLKSVDRIEISKQIGEAREKGDLSENAEYDAAKEAQGLIEKKIAELEAKLTDVKIIDPSQIDTSKVMLLSQVELKNTKNGSTLTYQIVPESEADLKNKKLSVTSPIGKGLLGKVKGDVAEIKVPNGIMQFEILNISIADA